MAFCRLVRQSRTAFIGKYHLCWLFHLKHLHCILYHGRVYEVIRSVLVLVIIFPISPLSAVGKQKYGSEALKSEPTIQFLLNLWVKRRLVSNKFEDMACFNKLPKNNADT